ncbi:hypothetical protein CJ178_12260 [Rhodococcus sp. ACPA4]|uniref:MFS transporter n=1 Tax=Nocardia globerula TaxID=1818 RepID=A0A652YW07_NOCGL|nr:MULTISPECIES: hypothetical protein [Rhodococcus]NMD59723.1 hypothetical protein [Nocardia globerula]PBC42267.1 hypothetical protein CJ178_12260 [Rhodococcus sp. ACPA4]PVX64191.1 hypothetical protein C8E04_1464 [Rhodococcus globerulus]
MPVDFRAILTTLAALASGALAAFALTNPPLQDWAIVASQSEIDRWISSGPTSVALGAVVAVLACALSQRSGSRRAAWIVVTAATAIIALIRVAVPDVAVLDLLITLVVLKSVAAGVILGCAVAASWDRTAARNGVLLGVIAGYLSAHAFGTGAGRMSTSAVGEPAWFLLAATAVLAVACAISAQSGFRIRRPDAGEIRVALIAVIALAIGHRILGSIVDRQEFASKGTAWVVMILCAAAALALTAIVARQLGEQSGAGGKFLWAATALAAASTPTLLVNGQFGQWASLESPWVVVLASGVAVALGLRLSKRIPATVAVVILAAVPLSELLPFTTAHGAVSIVVKIAALGFGGAALLGALAPASLVDATLGLAIPFAAMTFTSITVLAYQLSWPPVRVNFASVEPAIYTAEIPVDYVNAQTIGSALLFVAIIAVCGAAIRRVPQNSNSAESGVSDAH